MPGRFDEYIDGKFELDGEYHGLVEPATIGELAEAFRTRDLIQDAIGRHMPDEAEGYERFMREQNSYIRDFMDKLGDFDNSQLIRNIGTLLRKHGLRMGDLENALGISTGYISRTSKPGSSKKMSIDIVWKIARLFDVGLQSLIESDLSAPSTNTNLVLRFISKLLKQTGEEEIVWEDSCEALCAFENYLFDTGVMINTDKHRTRYRPTDHLNPEYEFFCEGMVYVCKDIRPGWYLAVLPYVSEKLGTSNIDFIFFRTVGKIVDGRVDTCEVERCFYSTDDPHNDVCSAGYELYRLIDAKAIDTQLTKSVKSWMTEYLVHFTKNGKQ